MDGPDYRQQEELEQQEWEEVQETIDWWKARYEDQRNDYEDCGSSFDGPEGY